MLRPLQGLFDPGDSPDLLVGLASPDDAAVWRLDAQRALVVTTDFFTPVVDEPYDYGAIAAANALSDLYAMGARPFMALNIAALPASLPPEITAEILLGGAEKVKEAGAVLAGGHTIQDQEPKYGLVALGMVDPDKMLTKAGAQAGDVLVLSKPLGMGVVTTALKRGLADPADVSEAAGWMKRLNRQAAELAVEHGVRGGTDVTGYGLLGHAGELASASQVGLRFAYEKMPFTRGAQRYAQEWIFPGGSIDNRQHFGGSVTFESGIDEAAQMLLFDAQTSGGLLLAVSPGRLDALFEAAAHAGQPLWVVGQVTAGSGIKVTR